jgi:1,4-alpha-glucan branching enzyme
MSKVITHSLLLILTSTYLKLENITDYMINLSASIRVRWRKGVYFAVWAPTAHSVSVIGF